MATLGEFPAKHKKVMGSVVVTLDAIIHKASETELKMAIVEKWVLAKEGPPPRIPLVQLILTNEKKRTFEFTSWEHQKIFSTFLEKGRTHFVETQAAGGAAATAAPAPGTAPATPAKSSPGVSPPQNVATASPPLVTTQQPVPLVTILPPALDEQKPAAKEPIVSELDDFKPLTRILIERPNLARLYQTLVPGTLSNEAFFASFKQEIVLSKDQLEPAYARYNFAVPIKGSDENAGGVNLSQQDIDMLFQEHPSVKKVYQDVVIEAQTMTGPQFFGRFFRSSYHLKCEGKEPVTKGDALFDSLKPVSQKISKETEGRLPKLFTQWNTDLREETAEKEPLYTKLNKLSAEPLESIFSSRTDDESLRKKLKVEDSDLKLQPLRVFKHKDTGQVEVGRNEKFHDWASRKPKSQPENPQFQRSFRHFLKQETKNVKTHATISNPELSEEFFIIESILTHYYSTNDAEIREKLKKKLETFTPPPTFLRAVTKIINL